LLVSPILTRRCGTSITIRGCPPSPQILWTKLRIRALAFAVSSITLAEITYLIEKKRVPANAYADLEGALDDPEHAFTEVPCTKSVVRALRMIPRADIPDMPDRLIAATAASLGVPIISRDGRIRASAVHTIW
jgi:predicted nucleic acid-binding protein